MRKRSKTREKKIRGGGGGTAGAGGSDRAAAFRGTRVSTPAQEGGGVEEGREARLGRAGLGRAGQGRAGPGRAGGRILGRLAGMEVPLGVAQWLVKCRVATAGQLHEGLPGSRKVAIEEGLSDRIEGGEVFAELFRACGKERAAEQLAMQLKSDTSPVSKLYNWGVLGPALGDVFRVEVDQDTKALIVAGDSDTVASVLTRMCDAVGGRVLAEDTVGGGGGAPAGRPPRHRTSSLVAAGVVGNGASEGGGGGDDEFISATELVVTLVAEALGAGRERATEAVVHSPPAGVREMVHSAADGGAQLYRALGSRVGALSGLLGQDAEETRRCLACLTGGFWSPDTEVAGAAAKAFRRLGQRLFPEEGAGLVSGSPGGEVFAWFVSAGEDGGLSPLRAAFKAHPDLLVPLAGVVDAICGGQYNNLVTGHLKSAFPDPQAYCEFLSALMEPVAARSLRGTTYERFVASGAPLYALSMGVRYGEASYADGERMAAFALMRDAWLLFPREVGEREEDCRLVLDSLKKGCREEGNLEIQVEAHACLYALLDAFVESADRYAPLLYKTLIFSLMENHPNERLREFILCNMRMSLEKWQGLPIGIVIEPLVKQISLHGYTNVDFDFFMTLSTHRKLEDKHGMLLLDLFGRICVEDPLHGRLALVPFLSLVDRFNGEEVLVEYLVQYVKTALGQYRITRQGGKLIQHHEGASSIIKEQAIEVCMGIARRRHGHINDQLVPIVSKLAEQRSHFAQSNGGDGAAPELELLLTELTAPEGEHAEREVLDLLFARNLNEVKQTEDIVLSHRKGYVNPLAGGSVPSGARARAGSASTDRMGVGRSLGYGEESDVDVEPRVAPAPSYRKPGGAAGGRPLASGAMTSTGSSIGDPYPPRAMGAPVERTQSMPEGGVPSARQRGGGRGQAPLQPHASGTHSVAVLKERKRLKEERAMQMSRAEYEQSRNNLEQREMEIRAVKERKEAWQRRKMVEREEEIEREQTLFLISRRQYEQQQDAIRRRRKEEGLNARLVEDPNFLLPAGYEKCVPIYVAVPADVAAVGGAKSIEDLLAALPNAETDLATLGQLNLALAENPKARLPSGFSRLRQVSQNGSIMCPYVTYVCRRSMDAELEKYGNIGNPKARRVGGTGSSFAFPKGGATGDSNAGTMGRRALPNFSQGDKVEEHELFRPRHWDAMGEFAKVEAKKRPLRVVEVLPKPEDLVPMRPQRKVCAGLLQELLAGKGGLLEVVVRGGAQEMLMKLREERAARDKKLRELRMPGAGPTMNAYAMRKQRKKEEEEARKAAEAEESERRAAELKKRMEEVKLRKEEFKKIKAEKAEQAAAEKRALEEKEAKRRAKIQAKLDEEWVKREAEMKQRRQELSKAKEEAEREKLEAKQREAEENARRVAEYKQRKKEGKVSKPPALASSKQLEKRQAELAVKREEEAAAAEEERKQRIARNKSRFKAPEHAIGAGAEQPAAAEPLSTGEESSPAVAAEQAPAADEELPSAEVPGPATEGEPVAEAPPEAE